MLHTFIEAEYPARALAENQEGSVVLRLDISAEGNVSGAEVLQAAGFGFDEAAQAAALRFTFEPARRGNAAVPSRILYTYEFRLPKEPPGGSTATPSPLEPAAETGSAKSTARGLTEPRPPRAPADETPMEVVVRGPSEAQRLRRSAEAVTVVETEHAQRQSADMGEVLARTQGVGVQREGGLGSDVRFSLNGLTDDQIRFFLDGVPLELAGYPFGIANVPVNLVERIEIYSGVVPIRFGGDALGGAVNLASRPVRRGTHADVSYQVGSFDTHRLTLSASRHHAPTGLFARGAGFFDYARNDYPVDVEVPDDEGQPSAARVYRFHDEYGAAGGTLEVGFVDRPWARKLLARGFVTDYLKEYPHNVVMTVPYGDVTYGETSGGGSLSYEHSFRRGLSIDATVGYTRAVGHFLDVGECVYDWFGRCVRQRSVQLGETDTRPHDSLYVDDTGFGRAHAEWHAWPGNTFRLSLAPTVLARTGDERRLPSSTSRDPLAAERVLGTIVTGQEHQLDLLEDRLENVLFLKQYVQLLRSEEPRPGNAVRRRDRDTAEFGVGDGFRYRLLDGLYAKLSYEWATRLPRPDEVFGDNVFIVANLDLEPEVSHNFNWGGVIDGLVTGAGTWRAAANGFLREAARLIVLIGNDTRQSYQNVFSARSLGVEASAGWTSWGEYVALDANATYVDFRNTSSEGTFGDFTGDRIPNRPYLFANGSGRLQFRGLFTPRDEVATTWTSRYVHEYFRGWESVGLREFKQTTPSQLVHSASVGYAVTSRHVSTSWTIEVQNLTDEPVFDFFGVQRPGRAFYAKATAQF